MVYKMIDGKHWEVRDVKSDSGWWFEQKTL